MRQRILARIQGRFEIVEEHLKIGPVELDFVRIADPDRVLDQVADEEDRRERLAGRRLDGDELHLPYWAQLWDSALGVAHFLCATGGLSASATANPEEHGQQAARGTSVSILDLGCGMGLAGTVAAALGHQVLFADLEPPALLFAALNSLPWRDRIRTRRANWRTDDLGEKFDLIIGADILYERAQWEHLDRFWKSHLKKDGTILLGEPGRQTGDAFPEWIGMRGWRIEEHSQPVATRPRPIRIFRLQSEI